MRVAVIGQGYVGLTISSGAISAGFEVIGMDKKQSVVQGLNSGKSHIEGISDSQIARAIFSGSSSFLENLQTCTIFLFRSPKPCTLFRSVAKH